MIAFVLFTLSIGLGSAQLPPDCTANFPDGPPGPPYNPLCCGLFATLEFDFLDFDKYETYFRADTTMTLPEAGTYTGPDDIEEYVRFSNGPTHDVTNLAETVDLNTADEVLYVTATQGSCIFRIARLSTYDMTAPALAGAAIDVATYFNVRFELTDLKVSDVEVYYSTPFLDIFFGSLTNTVGIATYICTVMRDNCASEGTWALNGYESIQQCVDAYQSLPAVDPPPAYADGKSKACRVIHSVFAATNPRHCPHISYEAQIDERGDYKCQTSQQLPTGLAPADKEYFEAFMVAYDIPVELGYALHPIFCFSDAECFDGWRCDTTSSGGRRRLAFGSHHNDADGICVYA